MAEQKAAPSARDVKPVDVINDAGKLLQRCAGYRFDLDEQADGWKIHHAIDTDVFVNYLLPTQNYKHGKLFTTDRRLSQIVVLMTCEYIVRELVTAAGSGKGQLLVISPHDQEINSNMLRLQLELHELHHQLRHSPEQLEVALNAVRNHNITNQEIASLLVNDAAEFVRIMKKADGPQGAIHRFTDLPPSRLINLVRYKEPQGDGSIFEFPSVPQNAKHKEFRTFSDRECQWQEALKQGAHSKPSGTARMRPPKGLRTKSPSAVRTDAQVLTTLEWINATLEPQRRRVVLITGSDYLYTAAADSTLPPNPWMSHPPQSFETHYLRHPQAFFGDDQFFSEPNGEGTGRGMGLKVLEWLNTLLPQYVGIKPWNELSAGEANANLAMSPRRWHRVALQARQIAAGLKESRDPDEQVRSFVTDWSKQLRMLAVENGMTVASRDVHTPRIVRIVKELRLAAGADWTVEKFREYLTDQARESMHKLFFSTAFLGVLVLRTEESRVRGIPALRFNGAHKAAQEKCTYMQGLMFVGKADIDLHVLYKELGEGDPDNYHAHVLHAYAYAIRGHWSASCTFCRFAISVADTILAKDPEDDRRGREACYLMSVAQRRLAHDAKHPRDGQRQLESARQNLEEARRRDTPGMPPDPRFDSEALAFDVSSLLLRRFGTLYITPETEDNPLSLLREKLPVAKALLTRLEGEPLREVMAWITRQIFTNILTLALLAEIDARDAANVAHRADLMALIELFRERNLSPDTPNGRRDQLSDIIYWAAVIVFDKDVERAQRARKHLGEVDVSTFGGDAARVEAFANLSRRAPP